MDSQSRISDVAGIAALVQCLVRRHADTRRVRAAEPEALAESRFLAARDGMSAHLVDGPRGNRRPVNDALAEVLDECQQSAARLGCASELEIAAALAADPGAVRQRRLAACHGLDSLPALLGEEFVPAGHAASLAGSCEPQASRFLSVEGRSAPKGERHLRREASLRHCASAGRAVE
jgi:glutamate---cysteine ligase / carboxylate-amine ligase